MKLTKTDRLSLERIVAANGMLHLSQLTQAAIKSLKKKGLAEEWEIWENPWTRLQPYLTLTLLGQQQFDQLEVHGDETVIIRAGGSNRKYKQDIQKLKGADIEYRWGGRAALGSKAVDLMIKRRDLPKAMNIGFNAARIDWNKGKI